MTPTELFTEVKAVCANDLLFVTEEKNFVVVSRRL
jgi:hypothetical protein